MRLLVTTTMTMTIMVTPTIITDNRMLTTNGEKACIPCVTITKNAKYWRKSAECQSIP
jgi:hypothetical protein